jgi:hypothetical protein
MKETESILESSSTHKDSAGGSSGASSESVQIDTAASSLEQIALSLRTFPDEAYVTLLKYIEIRDIVKKMLLLNRRLRELFIGENYLLFKHFLRDFNILNGRMKRTEIPAKVPIM